MAFVLIAGGVIGAGAGIAKAISGGKKKREARAEKAKAQADLDARKAQYASMDTSNPFANMQNMMEDMTVNQQQAEFEKQMAQQNQANIMEGMRGAAGGSGIAALAQQMASQGALASQKAAVTIGQQEQAIQEKQAGEAARLQGQELQGEVASRQLERERDATLMGMSAADLEKQEAAEQAANQQMWSGIGGIGGSIAGMAGGDAIPLEG